METKKQSCTCGSDEAVVLACSGASDVGHISDLVARKLRDNGIWSEFIRARDEIKDSFRKFYDEQIKPQL